MPRMQRWREVLGRPTNLCDLLHEESLSSLQELVSLFCAETDNPHGSTQHVHHLLPGQNCAQRAQRSRILLSSAFSWSIVIIKSKSKKLHCNIFRASGDISNNTYALIEKLSCTPAPYMQSFQSAKGEKLEDTASSCKHRSRRTGIKQVQSPSHGFSCFTKRENLKLFVGFVETIS